ncbi:hypothetical protein CDAR_66821 [Caerostris darwini]|uniref:Uncharacterized protein n=1 Tax=Caerostris darwini TaxID=1538125 RepID=A0AAV4VZ46_9ARAC|nr:hypothetical protein CDAR_66821 [Caerostris darwini]
MGKEPTLPFRPITRSRHLTKGNASILSLGPPPSALAEGKDRVSTEHVRKETKVKAKVYEAESITPPFPSRRFSVVTINNVFMRESFQRKRKDREDAVSGELSMLIKTPEIKLREIVLDEGGQLEKYRLKSICQITVSITNETPQHKRKALLKLIPVVDEVFSKLNVDEMDPLRKTPSGKRYLIAIMCLISRYPDAIPALAISSASVIDFLL